MRDQIGVTAHLTLAERSTFHEIRTLAAHLFKVNGLDPQTRMAHSDAKSTKIHPQNHVDWIEVANGGTSL
ncbi:MAG: hypothetical protein ACL7BU_10290 [Candidatus Phlomobacter fragariae]